MNKNTRNKVLISLITLIFALVIIGTTYAFVELEVSNDSMESFQRITGSGSPIEYLGHKISATNLMPGDSKSDTFIVRYNDYLQGNTDNHQYKLYFIVDYNGFLDKNESAYDQVYVRITEETTAGNSGNSVSVDYTWQAESTNKKHGPGKDLTEYPSNPDGSKVLPILTEAATITPGSTHTYTILIMYANTNKDQEIYKGTTFTGHIEITDGDVVDEEIEHSFATDSWLTIARNVESGNTDAYNIGDVKCVKLKGFTHTGDNGNGCTASNEFAVKIANKDACPAGLDSESACGFVLEFADIITYHNMNPAGELNGTQYNNGWNIGGWPASSMYSYVNKVDGNSSSGTIFKALPSDLQEVIISTHVVSGPGDGDRNAARTDGNWESDDLLYLLSPVEIYGNNPAPTGTTDNEVSRQLKYYAGGYELNGEETSQITTSNNGSSNKNTPIKKQDGSASYWWMRSAMSTAGSNFRIVSSTGSYGSSNAYSSNGVAPAFRIGLPPEEPESFATDSWKTIQNAVKTGNTDAYNIGDVKCVPLDGFTHEGDNGNGCTASNEFAVRIVNKDVCPAGLDSESACGFVLEFADVITDHIMNPAGELNGTEYTWGWNIGGWPVSSLYSYVNEVDGNSSSGTIFKALPSELQEVIIPTHVVSGHGSGDSNSKREDGNWESDDLLYLLSPVEVYGNNPAPKYTSDNAVSRQLKYYAGGYELNGEETSQITTSNYGSSNKNAPIKKKDSSARYWWMRSAYSTDTDIFRGVSHIGGYGYINAYNSYGVAPAFRIG